MWIGRALTVLRWMAAVVLLLATVVAGAQARRAVTDPAAGEALRARGLEAAYNLDYDRAEQLLLDAARADPSSAATERALASEAWIRIQFARGAGTVDDYLGGLTRTQVALRQAPPDLVARFRQHIDRALTLAEAGLEARPNDVNALYDHGAALGLQASYVATVEGRILGAMRAARRAFDAHERVLARDPSRTDAALVVGTYRYIVGSMPLPMRLMAYVVGFGGDKDRGLRLVEQAAGSPGVSQAEARFALVLLYNRERRYDAALRVLATLREGYPRNRLLWLESGATALRAGRPQDAERWLAEGLARLAQDRRPRMFGEEALWRLKRGQALLALRRRDEAATELRQAASGQARGWVQARAHLALGQLADLAGDRAAARREYDLAIPLADRDNDPATADAAKRYARTPFEGL